MNLYGESKITRIETSENNSSTVLFNSFIWRIQDNKDWNDKLKIELGKEIVIYMENPR